MTTPSTSAGPRGEHPQHSDRQVPAVAEPASTATTAAAIPALPPAGNVPVIDYIAITPDGTLNQVRATLEPAGSLKLVQSAVGGFIECVALADDMFAVVNEEGVIIGLPYNPVATGVCAAIANFRGRVALCGNVVLIRSGLEDFESLTSSDQQLIIAAWAAAVAEEGRPERRPGV
jgi:hypothetical protein